jgi:hypothetical protein
MKIRCVVVAVLLLLMPAGTAWAQYTSYVATPAGISYGASPSVLSLEIQTGSPRAVVRKNDGSAFQTSGTMRLYQDGAQIASATQSAGIASVILPFAWKFTSGTHSFYATTSTNPYASGSVSVTAGYIPAPPAGVTATATSSSSVAVSWNSVSGATRYKVRFVNTGAQTGDLTTTSYTWTGLSAGTNQCFAVLACSTTGFCSSPSAQACAMTQATPAVKYKVGVVLFGGDDTDASLTLTRGRINDMIRDVAKYRPVRSGSGREVRLVVELEVPWSRTANYNFWWFQQFARLCEELQVKWTPLLSPHYVPSTIQQAYAADRVTDMNVKPLDPTFLKFSPSSPVWGAETAQWVDAFIRAMQNDAGVNHFAANKAIDEVLVANEMQYPGNVLTSRDARSVQQWQLKYGTGTAYPTTLTTAFRTFRAEQLSYAINAMVDKARRTLDSLGLSTVGVSSKLYPYNFPRSNEAEDNKRAGYTDSSLAFLDSNFRGLFAMDSYPNSYCGSPWSVTSDYAAAHARTAKPLYVAEFNVAKGSPECTNVTLTRAQVSSAAITGFQSYTVRSFTFFAWNPGDKRYVITADQKLGLADAMNWIVP